MSESSELAGHAPAKIVGGRRVPDHKPRPEHSNEPTPQTNIVSNVLSPGAGNPADTAVINAPGVGPALAPAPKHEHQHHEPSKHAPPAKHHNPRQDHNHLHQPGSRNNN